MAIDQDIEYHKARAQSEADSASLAECPSVAQAHPSQPFSLALGPYEGIGAKSGGLGRIAAIDLDAVGCSNGLVAAMLQLLPVSGNLTVKENADGGEEGTRRKNAGQGKAI